MIGKAIYNILTTNAAVSALVSTRVYPNVNFNSKTQYPYIVFQNTDDDPHDTKSGVSSLNTASILVKCFSNNALAVEELAEKVRIALDRKKGTYGTIVVQSIQYKSMMNSFEFQEIDSNDGLFMTAQNFDCRYEPVNS
jgi:archaellin